MGVQQRDEEERGGVTSRAVVCALALIVLLSVVAFYVVLVHFTSGSFGTGVPAAAPFAVLFLLTAAAMAPIIRRRAGLTRRELLVIYAIVLMGAPLVSQSILGWMLPHSIIQQYVARAIPDWQTGFLHLVPRWFSPTDPEVVESFFQGRSAVPWSVWWVPLAAWCSFLVALVVASLCLTVLVRRQWITNERLSFPLAQIPLETVRDARQAGGRFAAGLAVGWLFWAGLFVSLGIGLVNNLSTWFPAIPAVPTGPVMIVAWQKVGPLAGLGQIDLVLWPWMIALAYLIPKELSFSAWFFWLVRVGLTMIAITAGASPQQPIDWYGNTFPAPYWQGVGAVLALSVWTSWSGRVHLGRAIRIALSRESGRADADEPLPYRWALLGFCVSFGWLVYLCWLAGCRLVVGVALIGLIMMFYLMWARLRAETGMGFLSYPLKVNDVLVDIVGSSVFRPRELVMIYSARWSYSPGYGQSPEIFPGNAVESMKIADAAGIRTRPLMLWMFGGFTLALVIGVYIMMTGIYHYGFHGLTAGVTQDYWLDSQLRLDGARIFNSLTNATPFDVNASAAVGAGAGVAVLLGVLRLRFWWWPFHPVGYMAANVWGTHWNSMPFFVGWLGKLLVIRYGGLRLYRRTVPFAIGLIGGDLLSQFIWGVVQAIVRSAG